jgi:hypothetical protein
MIDRANSMIDPANPMIDPVPGLFRPGVDTRGQR